MTARELAGPPEKGTPSVVEEGARGQNGPQARHHGGFEWGHQPTCLDLVCVMFMELVPRFWWVLGRGTNRTTTHSGGAL